MRYIIYGVNRIAKDFLYIFNELDIQYLTDDADDTKFLADRYRVEKLDAALTDTSYDQIIICDYDKKEKEKRLQEKGLIYGRDYVYEEDFFAKLDDISIPDDRKMVIWGTGTMCRLLMEENLPRGGVEAFIDSYRENGNTFMEKPVFLPKEIVDWKQYYVIIAVVEDAEIQDMLLSFGMTEYTDYIRYQKLLDLPSILLKKTIFDPVSYNLTCNTMLNHLEILERGNTRFCCTTFVNRGIDNILNKSYDEVWRSNMHKILCLSIENKTFSFCDKSMCPLFVGKKPEYVELAEEDYREMKPSHEVLAVGYDPSCNLSCRTCRPKLHSAKDDELDIVNRITDKIIKEYLGKSRFLVLAGGGEVFASPAYKRIYRSSECNLPFIRLLTNGMLFTKKNWENFTKGKDAKIMLTVSIDAATKSTYEYIRRNGNFDVLKANMEFASRLRKNGSLSYLRINFVVQRENFKEMIPFVEWGRELGVDEVFFTKILNWGTYTKDEFEQISMMEQDGITSKAELKTVLDHPVMKDKIVDLGTIQYSHKIDQTDTVENYYMWELEKRGGKLFD